MRDARCRSSCGAGLRALRAATNRPVNLNFFVHPEPREDPARRARMQARLKPYYDELGIALPDPPLAPPPPFGEAHLEVLLSEGAGVVSFHYGLPAAEQLRALQRAEVQVLSSATTVEEARWLEAQGVAAVIAQGYEAGGHRGTFRSDLAAARIGTLALVPQIADAVACPVIAAGGIMDGRGIAAALLLGAAGVQLGTAFLGCPEAKRGAAAPRGVARRRRRRHAAEQGSSPASPPACSPTATSRRWRMRPRTRSTSRSSAASRDRSRQAAAAQGSGDFMPLYAGQGAGLWREMPAAALLETLVAETERAWAGR